MARILLSYFSDYGEAMYDAICSVLRKNGNDIFRFNINCDYVESTGWGGECKIIDNKIISQINTFSPEIVLNFNHSLPINLYDVISDTCKICIIDADNPETFWNKGLLSHNSKRYFFLGLQSYSKEMYEKCLLRALEDEVDYIYFPPATVVKSENLAQDKNISFIGSNFYPLYIPENDNFYKKEALLLYDEFVKNYFFPFENVNNKEETWYCSNELYKDIRAYYVGQDRLKSMQVLTDLGFTFYGVRWWNRIAYYDFELAKCFDDTPKVSIEDNQWVYNTSKVSVNISHPQAKSSFSWRVMDIMASNACLLMEDKPDWKDLFGKFLSKETLDTVIYSDRYDMRKKAIILLKDDNLRARCVADLNNAIEQNGRWEHRFIHLEKFLNVSILGLNNMNPTYIYIKQGDGKNQLRNELIQCKIVNKKNIIKKMKFLKRGKMFFYAVCLACAQIPIVDFIFRRKRRDKILQKIHKYWR